MQNETCLLLTDFDEISHSMFLHETNESGRKISVALPSKLKLMFKLMSIEIRKSVLISLKLMNKSVFCIITLFKMVKQASRTEYK